MRGGKSEDATPVDGVGIFVSACAWRGESLCIDDSTINFLLFYYLMRIIIDF